MNVRYLVGVVVLKVLEDEGLYGLTDVLFGHLGDEGLHLGLLLGLGLGLLLGDVVGVVLVDPGIFQFTADSAPGTLASSSLYKSTNYVLRNCSWKSGK